MIKYKNCFRILTAKFHCVLNFSRANADVKQQSKFSQLPESLHKFRRKAVFWRLFRSMQNLSYTLDIMIPGIKFQEF